MDFFFLTRGKKQAWLAKTKTLNEKQRNGFRLKFSKNQISQKTTTQEEKESRKRVNIIIVVIFIKGV